MPAFNPSIYSSHPIQIPPEFPKILKQYTKAAIRTQPADLLLWSASYFRCLSNGEVPPVKERLEYPLPETEYGLTPGLLRVLYKQVGCQEVVSVSTLKAKWRGICLSLDRLDRILQSAGCKLDSSIAWQDFVCEAAMTVATEDTVEATMKILCEVMAKHPDGVGSSLPADEFIDLLKKVCVRKGIDQDRQDETEQYFKTAGEKQDGVLTYENFKAAGCPQL